LTGATPDSSAAPAPRTPPPKSLPHQAPSGCGSNDEQACITGLPVGTAGHGPDSQRLDLGPGAADQAPSTLRCCTAGGSQAGSSGMAGLLAATHQPACSQHGDPLRNDDATPPGLDPLTLRLGMPIFRSDSLNRTFSPHDIAEKGKLNGGSNDASGEKSGSSARK
jgi:hypothetical protein